MWGLLDFDVFKTQTDHVVIGIGGKKLSTRGANISKIDHLLKYWDLRFGYGTASDKIEQLSKIVHACKTWCNTKSVKKGTPDPANANTLYERRFHAIRGLGNAALQLLLQVDTNLGAAYQEFNQRKAAASAPAAAAAPAAPNRPLRPMDDHYSGERITYHQSGKTNAVSGSLVAAHLKKAEDPGSLSRKEREAYKEIAKIQGNKSIDQLNGEEFRKIAELAGEFAPKGMNVEYLGKLERVQHMIFVDDNGMLVNYEGHFFERGTFPYVIDEYGNPFCGRLDPSPGFAIFNHSSLNVGGDVICAGTITIGANGRLQMLSNASGHYKPRRENLDSAADLFANDYQADTTQADVHYYSPRTGARLEGDDRNMKLDVYTFQNFVNGGPYINTGFSKL